MLSKLHGCPCCLRNTKDVTDCYLEGEGCGSNLCNCNDANVTCLVRKSHILGLGLVSMMLHYVIVKPVVLVGLIGMHKTGCSGETRLVLHVPSS